MKKLLYSRIAWLYVLIALVVVNIVGALVHTRLDLTTEKRFTISNATRTLLRSLDSDMNITVFLDGELPAGFRKLGNSTEELLQEFRRSEATGSDIGSGVLARGLTDSARAELLDSLRRLGINPTNVRAQAKEGEGEEQRLVYPGAVLEYKDRVIGVDLLQGVSSMGGLNSLNTAEALLEYKFSNAIYKLNQDSVPVVGYLLGNGQPNDYEVFDLTQRTLRNQYGFSAIPIDSVGVIPDIFDALVIVKPVKPFTEQQKLKLDQYIMHGGKIVWLIDNLYASMDSLSRSAGSFIAFDMGLNLDDLLFRYGVRVNRDLVQDLNCTQIPSVVGNVGNKPQIELLPWPYFPLLTGTGNHPISNNLDYLLTQFPQSIDTVKSAGVKKTVLLTTSGKSRILNTPAKVEWASIRHEEDIKTFDRERVPVAVLLEGSFSSLYANRISSSTVDSLNNYYRQPFRSQSGDNKMIVIADGDFALNDVSQEKGPLQMGENPYTHYQYANKEFLLNCMEYLVGNSGLLETRGKNYTLRLLDKEKLETSATLWQTINIAVPVLLVVLFAFVYSYLRQRKYR